MVNIIVIAVVLFGIIESKSDDLSTTPSTKMDHGQDQKSSRNQPNNMLIVRGETHFMGGKMKQDRNSSFSMSRDLIHLKNRVKRFVIENPAPRATNSILKWTGLGKRSDVMNDSPLGEEQYPSYETYNGAGIMMKSRRATSPRSYGSALKWAGLGKRWNNDLDSVYNSKRVTSALKWTGLGKRADYPVGDGKSLKYFGKPNYVNTRSTEALKWMGLGKRSSHQTLKWVGLGKRHPPSTPYRRRRSNSAAMSSLKWSGLGKRNSDVRGSSYDGDEEEPMYELYEVKYEGDDDGGDNYWSGEDYAKRGGSNGARNAYLEDLSSMGYMVPQNSYLRDRPIYNIVASKKLNPIYQWSGLGRKRK